MSHAQDLSASQLAGKRIGMVTFSSYPADPRPRRAVDAFLKEGTTVDLLCEADDTRPKLEVIDHLTIIRIPVRHHRGGVIAYAYQYTAFTLLAAIILAWRSLRRRYHLVYVHNMPDVLVFSALVPKVFGAKVILDQHDPMPELMTTIFKLREDSFPIRIVKLFERWSIAFADRLITVNKACKKLFSARGCPPDKIAVVMNSPDDSIFPYRSASSDAGNTPRQRFEIMYHGSLVERNGLSLALDAMVIVRKTLPSAELHVFGSHTHYLEAVLKKAERLDLQESVKYFGPKRLEDLVTEIQKCDLGVIPNERNAFSEINTPTRIFEYLTLGKPVIAPRTSGIQDYFGSDSLFFFTAGDAEELAYQILSVYSDPTHALDVTERGQAVCRQHNWRAERQRLVGVAAGLINGEGWDTATRDALPAD
jgi:glycosyltransferase involved in cell wall biosynthesis